ncbi:MAG: nuclear transport factor 2 family protein [Blastocatellia bacterium]
MKMNRMFKSVLATGIILSVSLAGVARPKRTTADAEFRALIEAYYTAWSTINPDNPAKFYAKDADLIFYDIAPMKYNSWAEYKAGVIKAFFDNITSGKLTPNLDDLKVTRRGNVAWTTLTFHLSGTLKAGGSMELDARHTAIWEKRGGRWLIVHEHISVPLQG